MTTVSDIVSSDIKSQIEKSRMKSPCTLGSYILYLTVVTVPTFMSQNVYALETIPTNLAEDIAPYFPDIDNMMSNSVNVDNFFIDVESNVEYRELQNYEEMKLSFDKNQFEDNDGNYNATFETLAAGLKSIKMKKVHVDVDTDGGLITFCVNIGNKIQIDVAKSIDDDYTENEVMFSFLYNGSIVVMNSIDLENVVPMVEEIQAEVDRL